jgi:hypothetical protein
MPHWLCSGHFTLSTASVLADHAKITNKSAPLHQAGATLLSLDGTAHVSDGFGHIVREVLQVLAELVVKVYAMSRMKNGRERETR